MKYRAPIKELQPMDKKTLGTRRQRLLWAAENLFDEAVDVYLITKNGKACYCEVGAMMEMYVIENNIDMDISNEIGHLEDSLKYYGIPNSAGMMCKIFAHSDNNFGKMSLAEKLKETFQLYGI